MCCLFGLPATAAVSLSSVIRKSVRGRPVGQQLPKLAAPQCGTAMMIYDSHTNPAVAFTHTFHAGGYISNMCAGNICSMRVRSDGRAALNTKERRACATTTRAPVEQTLITRMVVAQFSSMCARP